MADDRKRFIELAEEIITRVEETEGPEWASCVCQLSEQLEQIRRKIGFPEWTSNDPEWPAFYVTPVYRDADLHGIAAEFADMLKRGFKEGKRSAYGVMLSRDPRVESGSYSLLWFQDRGSQKVRYFSGTDKQAVLILRRWIRAVSGLAQGAPAEPESLSERKPKPKKKRGRRINTDLKDDKRTFEAWQTKSYDTYEDLGKELRKPKGEVKLAIDRHRHRLSPRRKK